MPLLLMLAILLAFPFVELYLLVKLASIYGWWIALYLLTSAAVGWLLIQEERLAVFGRMFEILQSGHHPLLALFTTARRMVAGLLLIFPGVISDIIAIVLLLIPTPSKRTRRPPAAANDDVIEGEWRREE